MKNLPAWYHSRLALIGDAAHPFLPHQGQGAAIAIEDAVALGTVLERGLRQEEIPERLKLYNDIRYERSCKVQEFTRLAGLDVQDGKLDTIEFSRYNFAHDEFDNSTQKLREWKWAQLPKVAFRMPVAFGPDQSLIPSVRPPGPPPTFCTTSVHFRTSRTLIQGLLPPKVSGMFFDTPGTLSNCSLVHTQFNNVPWLQGGGYGVLGLYIHDVAHKGSSVYCEINARHSSSSVQVTASLNGHNWLTLALEDLKFEDAQGTLSSKTALLPGDAADTFLFSWRSVPKFSTENETDKLAELEAFSVKVSFHNADGTLQNQQASESCKATVRFESQDPSTPSELRPIVERLAEIPIYEVMGAQVIMGSGTPALKQVYRV